MALKVPVLPHVSEMDQLLSWEAELTTRWAQLQTRRQRAEQLHEKQVLLEASLRELDNENTAAALILEERRRALSVRQAQLAQDEETQKREAALAVAEAGRRQQSMEEETQRIDAAWRELERTTQQEAAAHADEMRALQSAKQRSLGREGEARMRHDAVQEQEAQLLARFDALRQQKQHSLDLLRQTLAQLQRELNERQATFTHNEELSE